MTEEKKTKPKEGVRKLIRNQGLTLKQEAFAQKLAAGVHFATAWNSVYDTTNMNARSSYQKAWVDERHPKIVARVKELREQIEKATNARLAGEKLPSSTLPAVREAANAKVEVVERVIINRQSLTEMLLADRVKAHELGQISASVGAAKAVAQLHGLISDSRETKAEKTEIENMSADQLREFISTELTQVGLSPSDVGLDFVSMKPKTNAIN